MKPQLLLPLLLAALLPMTASAQSGEENSRSFNTSAAYDILAVFRRRTNSPKTRFHRHTGSGHAVPRPGAPDRFGRPSFATLQPLQFERRQQRRSGTSRRILRLVRPRIAPAKGAGCLDRRNMQRPRQNLSYCLQRLAQAGYAQYWRQEQVQPLHLNNAIEQYRIDPEQLEVIHQEITRLAGRQPLDATGSRIYILGNIGQRFRPAGRNILLYASAARSRNGPPIPYRLHAGLYSRKPAPVSLSGELLDMLQRSTTTTTSTARTKTGHAPTAKAATRHSS